MKSEGGEPKARYYLRSIYIHKVLSAMKNVIDSAWSAKYNLLGSASHHTRTSTRTLTSPLFWTCPVQANDPSNSYLPRNIGSSSLGFFSSGEDVTSSFWRRCLHLPNTSILFLSGSIPLHGYLRSQSFFSSPTKSMTNHVSTKFVIISKSIY